MFSNQFHHVGIINRFGTQALSEPARCGLEILRRRGIPYIFDLANAPQEVLSQAFAIKDWHEEIDLAIVLGGDGTFLYAGRSLHSKQIPIVGINAGHLGFLAD